MRADAYLPSHEGWTVESMMTLGKFAADAGDDDDDGAVQPEWERQFVIKETQLSTISTQVVQLHVDMNRLVIAIRDEANRLRTCGTA